MTDNERLMLIKINQKEINKLEMLKMYYKEKDKDEKIKDQLVILSWLNKIITKSL